MTRPEMLSALDQVRRDLEAITAALREEPLPAPDNAAGAVERVICEASGLRLETLRSRSRPEPLTEWRHLLAYLLYTVAMMDKSAIGRRMGRDHSAIGHSVSHVLFRRSNEVAYDVQVGTLTAAAQALRANPLSAPALQPSAFSLQPCPFSPLRGSVAAPRAVHAVGVVHSKS